MLYKTKIGLAYNNNIYTHTLGEKKSLLKINQVYIFSILLNIIFYNKNK